MDIERANQQAVEKMMSARPMLTGLATAQMDSSAVVAITGNVPEKVAELKKSEGPDLIIQGSSLLFHSLLGGKGNISEDQRNRK